MFRKLIVAGAFALAACNVDNVVNNLKQQAIDAAFQTIVQNAKDNGGDAVMLHAGTAGKLVVTNTASPLYGAEIDVPADALPADASNVALAIQTPPAGTPGLGLDPDNLKNAGPVSLVVLMQLPEVTEVKLVKPITITLPYAKDVSYPAAKLQLSNFPKHDATTPKVVDGSKSDTAKKTVTGASMEPNILRAVWPVDFALGDAVAANSFIYKVTGSDNSVKCAGEVTDVTTKFTMKTRDTTSGLAVALAGVGSLFSLASTGATGVVAPPVATATVVVTPDVATLSLQCLGGTFAAANVVKSDMTFTNFVSADATAHPAVGAVDVSGQLDFTTATGEHVIGELKATVPDFSWGW